MAEAPSQQPPSPTAPPPSDSSEYWCYHCDKRVPVETQPDHSDAVVCFECKSGFVESIPTAVAPRVSDQIDDTFIQVLRLLAQAARDGEEDDAPPPPPSDRVDPSDDNDYLRIELDGWNNVNDNDIHDDAEEEEEEGERNEEGEGRDRDRDRSDDDVDYDENEEEYDDPDDEDDLRRRRRDVLRLRLRDIASRASNRRNRILDWAEILMGLEDHSIEFRLQVPDMDEYIGNPGDYVDAAGYEALLQNLAETDSGGRRGAPPAAKSAVIGLETVEIKSEMEAELCAICKDTVCVGGMAKKLPCGHGYHGDCIVPWLGSRNTCPVCRYELPTDDPEYEEDRKKRCGDCSSRSGGAVN